MLKDTTVYLDYNASTPVDARVVAAMQPYLQEYFGNPSSGHSYGKCNKEAISKARRQAAALIGARVEEIVFTGCGSEANNLAIKGVAFANRHKGNHIITCQTEHPAVLNVCRYLATKGFEITYLPVDNSGQVNLEELESAISDKTILISIMHANNETGNLQPISEIGKISRKYKVLFHTDAAQSVGKVPVNVDEMQVDLLTIVGHKFYGPKGIGALYIQTGTPIESLIHGAGHEGGRRAGTENTPYIVALGEAAELAQKEMKARSVKCQELITAFREVLDSNGIDYQVNTPKDGLPNTLNISFIGINANQLLDALPGIAATTGAACHDRSDAYSHVLVAIGLSPETIRGTIRFSFGQGNDMVQVRHAAQLISDQIKDMLNKVEERG